MSIGKRLFQMIRSQTQGLWERGGPASKTEGYPGRHENEKFSSSDSASGETSGGDSLEREYLANLELERFASFEDVQKAHRRMIKKYHPDLHATDPEKRKNAEQITVRLNEALNYFETKAEKGARSS